MKTGNNVIVRYVIAGVLFLAAMIVQVNLVYACQLTEELPHNTCCCDEPVSEECPAGGDADKTGHGLAKPCCLVDVVVKTTASLSNAAPVHTDNNSHNTFHPPFLIPPSDYTGTIQTIGLLVAVKAGPIGSYGSDTYLLTERIRE